MHKRKLVHRYGTIFSHHPNIYRGSGLIPIYRGAIIQRGSGIGSVLKGLIRFFQPALRKGLKTVTKTGQKLIKSDIAKDLGRKGVEMLKESGKSILTDVIEGKPLKESVKKQIHHQKQKLKNELNRIIDDKSDQIIQPNKKRQSLRRNNNNRRRSSRKRKRKTMNTVVSKKRKQNDIFS
jgi:hypothetical protein